MSMPWSPSAILQSASWPDAIRCSLIFVMGPGEPMSVGKRLLGSTVDHVLRHVLQPILSVRTRALGPCRNMAIATDFPSREALDCALPLFPEVQATVVHAYDETLPGLLPFDQMTGPLAERHTLEMRASVEKSMREFVEASPAARPNLTAAVEIGQPEAVLSRLAEQSSFDLVVVGTHGRTGLRRALIGSVAERLIGNSLLRRTGCGPRNSRTLSDKGCFSGASTSTLHCPRVPYERVVFETQRTASFSISSMTSSAMPRLMITMPSKTDTGLVSNRRCMKRCIGEEQLHDDDGTDADQDCRRAEHPLPRERGHTEIVHAEQMEDLHHNEHVHHQCA